MATASPTTSTTKHQPSPTKAISRPPRAGPTSTPISMPRLVRAWAAGISSWRTVRGISASRDGPLHRGGGGEHGREHEDQPQVRVGPEGTERVGSQHRGRDRLRHAGGHQEPLAVDVVGQRAAVQAEDHQGHQLDEPDGADGEVGAGDPVDLERDGDVGDHRAEVEDGAGHEEQAEVARGAQRGQVDAQRPQPFSPGHARSRQIHAASAAARRRVILRRVSARSAPGRREIWAGSAQVRLDQLDVAARQGGDRRSPGAAQTSALKISTSTSPA